jgi:hypothetical protein
MGRLIEPLIASAVLFGSLTGPALAQAPAPIGTWANQTGEVLVVLATGQCELGVNGKVTTAGACSWNPTSAGGILTIISQELRTPAPVYFNVVWVNQTTITVNGDVLTRRG